MTDHTHLKLLTDVGNVSVVVHHLNKWQIVPLSTVVVVVVVGGGDLHGSSTKGHVHHLISDDGELTRAEWMKTLLSYEMLDG